MRGRCWRFGARRRNVVDMQGKLAPPSLESVLGSASAVAAGRLAGEGPAGRLPLTPDMLREEPSGNLFGLTQNVGMGWSPASLGGPQYVIVSTHGGLRSEDGSPVALGYHTGHWEIGLLVRAAAESLGARFAQNLVSLDYAATMGCRACGSAGGGCQFLGTAATSQVVAEALGLALPHSALAPSGEPVWLELGSRSAFALVRLHALGIPIKRILTQHALENAMLVHAAFGGSTNLLLHIPAIAHAAGLRPPTLDDWIRVNRATPRLVDALPNGPRGHPTVQVFMAGGVPEVMLHLRRMGLLHGDVLTATGDTLDATLDWWAASERRRAARARLAAAAAVAPDDVIMDPDSARRAGLTCTVVFPVGNLAPDGAVVKATALDPSVVGDDQVYRHLGPARVFVDERDAIRAVKGATERPIRPGDVIVLIGTRPSGTGRQETAQITTALRYLPWGKHVALLTDGRFSGFSSGACVGHIGPEALHGGPIGRVRDDDLIEIVIDRRTLTGSVNLVGAAGRPLDAAACTALLEQRQAHPGLAPHPALPADTRLWAALQRASGGAWAGCVYDVDRIVAALEAGLNLTKEVK